jgi:hypothetical protein
MNIRRSAMSDAALSERRAAALESSAHSNAMKPAASKTGRDRRADVSYPAAGMEGPYAGKTWGDRRADVDSCGPAKPMKTTASKAGRDRPADVASCGPAKPVQTTAPSKTWRHWRADMGNSDAGAMETSGPAKAMKTRATSKTGRDRRADVGNCGAVKLMKIAAAKAAVEAAAGKTRGDGRGAGVETGRRMNAAGAKATKTRAPAKGRNAAGAQPDGRRSAAGA